MTPLAELPLGFDAEEPTTCLAGSTATAGQRQADARWPLLTPYPRLAADRVRSREGVEVSDHITQKLADIEEIKTLKARYFRLLDAKNWSEWANVFVDDLEFVYSDPTVQNVPPTAQPTPDGKARVGRDELIAFISEAMQHVTTVHHGHLPEITIVDESTATGLWALTNYFEYRAADGSLVWSRGYGRYEDEYVRTGVGWRIRRSEFFRRDMDSLR